jgi:hypothetical protein
MEYLIKFGVDGRRLDTRLAVEYTDVQKTEMIADGYELTSEEDWQKYCEDGGNAYIRGADGRPTPAPPHVPTKTEKLAQLEAEYEQEKAQLEGYFNTALLMDDTETQEELRSEMADLADWYAEEKKSIEGSAE